MYNIKSPDTPEEAVVNRNKIELRDSIQKTHNRIEYDRSITDRQRQHLKLEMHLMEQDYFEFFGKEVDSAS